jgi:2-oxoglutarate ferredoxin oxidoreductase subunit beta
VLSPCPTNWKVSPADALKFVEERMEKEYPPGVLKDVTARSKEG